MSAGGDSRRQEIYRVFGLLSALDEALRHVEVQLQELRLEESKTLIVDSAEAVASMMNFILPLVNQDKHRILLELTEALCEEFVVLLEAYAENDLIAVQTKLTSQLVPAYSSWKQELIIVLRTSTLS